MATRRQPALRALPALAEAPAREALRPDDWRHGRNRMEKSELIRDALLKAAAEVVGEVGYADASIALITRKAGVALGTFYNYFGTRQDILDTLLPALGRQLREHVREQARVGGDFAEREELSFRAFFSFLQAHPHFFRILNEAESFAPQAYHEHLDTVARGYMSFLSHASADGELPGYRSDELEVVTLILMAARTYIAARFAPGEGRETELPGWVVRAYMKFVLHGLQGAGAAPAPPRAARKRTPKGK
jgi:AcrR family transcriptional regulator